MTHITIQLDQVCINPLFSTHGTVNESEDGDDWF